MEEKLKIKALNVLSDIEDLLDKKLPEFDDLNEIEARNIDSSIAAIYRALFDLRTAVKI